MRHADRTADTSIAGRAIWQPGGARLPTFPTIADFLPKGCEEVSLNAISVRTLWMPRPVGGAVVGVVMPPIPAPSPPPAPEPAPPEEPPAGEPPEPQMAWAA